MAAIEVEKFMIRALDFFREMSVWSMTARMLLAMMAGGIIGLERARKGRAAGMRTYMFVSLGAALSMMISQYDYAMLTGPWAELSKQLGVSTDTSRFGAQVISGIGFLGVGTIIVTDRRQVKGLTTAAGLWASGCIGLAIGAGFVECTIVGIPMMLLSITLFPALEARIYERSRNMDFYVEFTELSDIGLILNCIRSFDIRIDDAEIEKKDRKSATGPNATFSIYLKNKRTTHAEVLSAVADLENVRRIEEI